MQTCLKCGWAHFSVTRKLAEAEVERFNNFFHALPREKQEDLYGNTPSSLEDYEKCMVCRGSYKNFRDSTPGDVPHGCTINPIIQRTD